MRELLKQRGLPALQSREEMLEILQREVYGYLPEKPRTVSFEVTGRVCRNFCAGKATGDRLTADGPLRSGWQSVLLPLYQRASDRR